MTSGKEESARPDHGVRIRRLVGWQRELARLIAISFSLFQLYTGYWPLLPMYQRVAHVTFAFSLIFLLYPFRQNGRKDRLTWDGLACVLLLLLIASYVLQNYFARAFEVGAEPPTLELVLGGILILLTLDASRRVAGWGFTTVTTLSLLYARFGEYFPGVLGHKNYETERIITGLYMTMEGVFGLLTGISASFVFLFILFGAFLRESGAGDFFIQVAYSLFGHVRGGPAKIAVVASSLFGMVSGSGLANAAGTGQFTIPLMKKAGYRPHFAAAVEAVSSEAGILMPPVMGGTVFIMMEILEVSYVTIMKAAVIIAVLYYLALFVMVDLEAVKTGLRGLPRGELPRFWPTFLAGAHFLIPPTVLVYMLAVEQVSPARAAFWATLSVPLVSWLRPSKGMGWRDLANGLENGALTALTLIGILVCANIVVGMISLTGIGLMMSEILITLSGGHMLLLLVLTMAAAIFLGMGLPTVAAYVILAILVAPALIKAGADPLAAHLFIFYYAIISEITPPVAPAAFVTANIADAPFLKTALTACRLAIVIFVLPFLIIYNPVLMLRGDWPAIGVSSLTAFGGVYLLACFLQGHFLRPTTLLERAMLLFAAAGLLVPGWRTDLVGVGFFLLVLLLQRPLVLPATIWPQRGRANREG